MTVLGNHRLVDLNFTSYHEGLSEADGCMFPGATLLGDGHAHWPHSPNVSASPSVLALIINSNRTRVTMMSV